jgi:hypothetical protein
MFTNAEGVEAAYHRVSVFVSVWSVQGTLR